MERFAGLNVRRFNYIEVFAEILSHCLGQKCLAILFSIIKERCQYSREIFYGTFENHEKRKSLAQQIFPHLRLSPQNQQYDKDPILAICEWKHYSVIDQIWLPKSLCIVTFSSCCPSMLAISNMRVAIANVRNLSLRTFEKVTDLNIAPCDTPFETSIHSGRNIISNDEHCVL